MLRLTKLADYGILLMTQLAQAPDCRLTASDLADRTHVPLPTVSKILQMLLHQGLLESLRGANGGYRLAHAAGDITVRDIIRTLEGPIALTECNLESCVCEQEPYCSISGNWQRLNEAVLNALETISLADMSGQEFSPVFRMERHPASSRADAR